MSVRETAPAEESGDRGHRQLRAKLCVLLLPLGAFLTLAWLGLLAWLLVRAALDLV